jgi:hypothetical protein
MGRSRAMNSESRAGLAGGVFVLALLYLLFGGQATPASSTAPLPKEQVPAALIDILWSSCGLGALVSLGVGMAIGGAVGWSLADRIGLTR